MKVFVCLALLLHCVLGATEELNQIKIGNYFIYGTSLDFFELAASVIVGVLVDFAANYEFNLCLMDFAKLIEMVYAAYYFWSYWWDNQDGSEIVGAIVYAIEGWHLGLNLRCY